eukprot:g10976.t1
MWGGTTASPVSPIHLGEDPPTPADTIRKVSSLKQESQKLHQNQKKKLARGWSVGMGPGRDTEDVSAAAGSESSNVDDDDSRVVEKNTSVGQNQKRSTIAGIPSRMDGKRSLSGSGRETSVRKSAPDVAAVPTTRTVRGSILESAKSFTATLTSMFYTGRVKIDSHATVAVVEIGEDEYADDDSLEDMAETAITEERSARKRASLSACTKQASVAYSIFTVDDSVDRYVIRFNSAFNRKLTLLLIATAIWTAGYVPFSVAFHSRIENDDNSERLGLLLVSVFNFLIDLVYFGGYCARMVTSVCDLTFGKEWCKVAAIREHVLKTATFWLDTVSLLPLLVQPVPPFAVWFFEDWNHGAKAFECIKLLRLWRLVAIPSSHLEAEYSISVHIGRVVIWVFLLGHVIGCLWFFLLESYGTTELHVNIHDDISPPQSLGAWYLFGLRDGVYILTGRVRPALSTGEMGLLAFWAPMGSFFFAIVSANCTVLLSRLDAVKRKHHEQMCFIRSAMKSLNLPEELRARIEKYHLFLAIHHNLNAYNSLFQGLSVQLFTELKATIYDKLFRNAPFFRNAPEEFIHSIVLALEETTFSPGENVIVQGEIGAEMYWILRGRCDVIDSSGVRVVATLCENNFFGEVALLVQTPRLCSVRAATYSLLAQITREKFLPIIDEFPNQKQYFVERIRSYQLEQNRSEDEENDHGDPADDCDENRQEKEGDHLDHDRRTSMQSGDGAVWGQKNKKHAFLLLDAADAKGTSDENNAFKQKFRKTALPPNFAQLKRSETGDEEQVDAVGGSGEVGDGVDRMDTIQSAGTENEKNGGGASGSFAPTALQAQHSNLPPSLLGGSPGGGRTTKAHHLPRSSFAQPGSERAKLNRRASFAQGARPGEDSEPLALGASARGGSLNRGSHGLGPLARRGTRQSLGEQSEGGTRGAIDLELESEVQS